MRAGEERLAWRAAACVRRGTRIATPAPVGSGPVPAVDWPVEELVFIAVF